ncbi:hypothetical protein GcC1_145013 [Golovinomyces cichoracearum]|uniref:Uncharacterized protein n=1 Tax=Golovinomyces cichoracearum TaxID=62708 RepID=A0A420HYZ8_9PEZI|nr:hypothetical protein GcC1_145013 [Golovinomyces cichoracearum]
MSGTTRPNSDTPMLDILFTDPFSGLSVEDKQEVLLMLEERRRNRVHAKPASEACQTTKAVLLPLWNGKQEDFSFFMDMLRTSVEKEMAGNREPSCLCTLW